MGLNLGVSSYANHPVKEITDGPSHDVMQLYSMSDKPKQERMLLISLGYGGMN
ncbi:Aldolase-type TIM barrel [Penicillium bovifimosum]|uniref:Aldolase-type TIM barrel n=1 Tax=Penicillium bovifimosum TaxID=126998 RepID=A0A9W9GW33_9EURO|nr:Aldolase-type TIM barrel [Penicillium bovifimosum]KAJ5130421.1 Aldolase-type TIM barrel [Penicillium bovifimosum]